MRKLFVDRFDGVYAICEDSERKLFALPVNELPDGVKEGDCLIISDEGEISVSAEETNARRKENRKTEEKLFK